MRAVITCLAITAAVGIALWLRRAKVGPQKTRFDSSVFEMPIDDTFQLKLNDSVVVVGVIAAGEITPGMQLNVQAGNSLIPVTVKGLEGGPAKPISRARTGDRVGVMLQGVNKDQIAAGATLIGGEVSNSTVFRPM